MVVKWIVGAILLFAGWAVAEQTNRVIYIDPVGADAPAGWNNVSVVTSNATSVLNDSLTLYGYPGHGDDAAARTERCRVGEPYRRRGRVRARWRDAEIFARSLANNTYGHINPFGTGYSNEVCEVCFGGLNPNQPYTFTFYASRESFAVRLGV